MLERQLKELLGSPTWTSGCAALGRNAWTQYAGVHAGTLAEVVAPGPSSDDTVVELADPGRVRLDDGADGRRASSTSDRTVRFPPAARPALEALVGR